LLTVPIFSALKAHDEASYLQIYKLFRDGVQQGRSSAELKSQVKVIFSQKVVPRYLPIAPDAPLVRYWRAQIAEMRELAAVSHQSCADYAFPDLATSPVDLDKALSRETLQEDLAALVDLIRETDLSRAPQIATPQIETDLEYARKKVREKIPNFLEVVSEPIKHKDQPGLLCASVVYFYSEILSWADARRSGAVLRYLFVATN